MRNSITSPKSYETAADVVKKYGNYDNATKDAIMIGELVYVGDKSILPPHFLPGYKGEISQKEKERILKLRLESKNNNGYTRISLLSFFFANRRTSNRIVIKSVNHR